MRWILCAALPLFGAGCISGTYSRFDVESTPSPEALAELQPGASLDDCIAVLGAPLYVTEIGTGAVLAWGGRQDVGWSLTVDLPTGGRDAPFSYTRDRRGLKGAALSFDQNWVLTRLEQGWLADVVPGTSPRPQTLDSLEE